MIARLKTGAVLLILTVSYFIVQLIVASRWPEPNGYSWADNMISDLGVPECLGDMHQYGLHPSRYICSPWHATMSTEFVLLGVLLGAATFLLTPLLPKSPLARAIPYLALLNCLGIVLVGAFPGSADEFPGDHQLRIILHPTGAYLELLTGLAIMIIAARVFPANRPYTTVTIVLIILTLIGMIASLAPTHLGLGGGTAERLALDPFVWWRVFTGIYILAALPRLHRAG
ncbi:DUF998 domain-containing protein [Nocardia sp. NPDC049149]|uniref:DUF998 domain-containing protein n=1 Tax=Nocardia sp. NPDC049149 TaxID=3364315 RepID=UPI00371E9E55